MLIRWRLPRNLQHLFFKGAFDTDNQENTEEIPYIQTEWNIDVLKRCFIYTKALFVYLMIHG